MYKVQLKLNLFFGANPTTLWPLALLFQNDIHQGVTTSSSGIVCQLMSCKLLCKLTICQLFMLPVLWLMVQVISSVPKYELKIFFLEKWYRRQQKVLKKGPQLCGCNFMCQDISLINKMYKLRWWLIFIEMWLLGMKTRLTLFFNIFINLLWSMKLDW